MAKKFDETYEVCKCMHVSLAEIVYAIKEKKATNLEEIGNFTDAGTCCNRCQNKEKDFGTPKIELYLDQIIKKFVG